MTEIALVVIVVALVIVEVYAIVNRRKRDTISEVTWRVVLRMPFVAFLLGYLMGHLTWPPAQCTEILLRNAR